tara:strand:+ start:4976 stop:5353 length:378 start_codon:yes stop_codon:yes gene_type:complete
MLNGCGTKGPSESEILRNEVIAIHDEVMPKMGMLQSLQRKALDKAGELELENPVDSAKVLEYKAVAYDLDHAYDAMFDWMHQYKSKDDEQTQEELKEYLEEQMVLVTEVNVEVKTALEKAEKLLK